MKSNLRVVRVWMRVKLKDIATYINGKAFKPSEWTESGIPIIRIQNLNNPDREFNYYDKEVAEKYIIDDGDILISWSATLDIFEWNRGKAYLNQHIFKVLFDKDLEVDKSYFQFSMKSVLHTLERFVHGSTMKHIVKKDFENIQIPLPPLTQQKKIAHTLDKAKELIELRKKSIEKLDALAKSLFVDMFGDPVENPMGWDTQRLEDLTTKITDGTHKTPKYQNDGVVFVSAKNVKKEQLNFDDCKYISEEEHEQLIKRCNPEYQDILLTKSGSTGMSALVPKVDFEFSLFESLCLIKFNKNIVNPFFLKLLLNSESTKHQYSGFIKGVAIKHLHLKDIRRLKIINPPLPLQQKFAKTIQKIENQKSLYEKELAKLEENFEALLAKSFA